MTTDVQLRGRSGPPFSVSHASDGARERGRERKRERERETETEKQRERGSPHTKDADLMVATRSQILQSRARLL